MSRDIPIIFSAPMMQALLAGRKTMTRRLAWATKVICNPRNGHFLRTEARPSTWHKIKPGDRLWVRESLTCVGDGKWRYKADDKHVTLSAGDPRVKEMIAWAHHKEQGHAPSIHMPRWASRITLVVTETKIERLQDISEDDAIAEGVVEDDGSEPGIFYLPGAHTISGVNAPKARSVIGQHASPRLVFRDLINNLHGTELWQQNPEVVALRFDVHKANINSMREAA